MKKIFALSMASLIALSMAGSAVANNLSFRDTNVQASCFSKSEILSKYEQNFLGSVQGALNNYPNYSSDKNNVYEIEGCSSSAGEISVTVKVIGQATPYSLQCTPVNKDADGYVSAWTCR